MYVMFLFCDRWLVLQKCLSPVIGLNFFDSQQRQEHFGR